uniref:Uncharacterized protein n=1 Tax=Solanum lycopersicum TaxID=4081 RepID=A0A3Q7EXR0_SOLLC
DSEVEARVE